MEGRENYIIMDIDQADIFRIALTPDQIRLLDWLNEHDMLSGHISSLGAEENPEVI